MECPPRSSINSPRNELGPAEPRSWERLWQRDGGWVRFTGSETPRIPAGLPFRASPQDSPSQKSQISWRSQFRPGSAWAVLILCLGHAGFVLGPCWFCAWAVLILTRRRLCGDKDTGDGNQPRICWDQRRGVMRRTDGSGVCRTQVARLAHGAAAGTAGILIAALALTCCGLMVRGASHTWSFNSSSSGEGWVRSLPAESG